MKPPFCAYRIDEGIRVMSNGKSVADPLAIALSCRCANGHYKDFAATLDRYYPGLLLGFDCGNGCYVIYKDLPRIENLDAGGGVKIRSVTRQPLIIKPLQWMVIRKIRGGNKFFHFPRDPGDWVMKELSEYRRERFELDGSWVGPTIDRLGQEARSRQDKAAKQFSNDIMDDVMSSADRGNPLQFRTQVPVKQRKIA